MDNLNRMEPIYFTPPPVRGRFVSGLWKDSPSQPAAPDPTATANAQTASNVQTAVANATLNRVNQTTPWGSQTYSAGPPDANGVSQWSSNITLAPDQQKLLDASNAISLQMANLGKSQIGNVEKALSSPLDFNKLPSVQNAPLATNVQGGNVQTSISPYGKIQNSVPSYGQIQDNVTPSGTIASSFDTSNIPKLATNAGYAGTASGVDLSNVPKLVGGDKLYGAMQQAQNAAYGQQQSRLDPQWNQQQHDLQNHLIQQGVMQNSDAWNRAMDDFSRQRNDAYQTAYNNAVANGNAAEAQLYGQGLSSNQNAFGQALSNSQLTNQAAQINNAQGLANAELQNQANQQQFGQDQSLAQFGNQAQNQRYTQNANSMQLANSAQNQGYTQGLASMQANNAAQAQGYNQNANNALFANNAQNQLFAQRLENAQLQNSASTQAFNQSLATRNQSLNELLQQQQNPLNILNALRTGSQVTAPQFGNAPQTNVAGTNTAGIAQQNYANQMAGYNAQVQGNNQLTSGLFSLGSAALLSDRRLKRNIQRVGTHTLGIGIYTYDYVWGEHAVGVMADEVETVMPEAVLTHPSGFKMVDYGRLA